MKVKSKIFYWYAAFVAAFIALTLLPAPNQTTLTRYHLTSTGLRILDITIIIPEALIWFAAFYGYERLYRYSQLVKVGKEGRQISKLAHGLLLLAISLPFSTILSGLLSLFSAHHPSMKATAVIFSNYVAVIFPLLAFMWISIAARGLSRISKTRPRLLVLNCVALLVVVLGIILCALISLGHNQVRATYHLSAGWVMLTLGIPYMYTWFLGLFAVAELYEYSLKVAGVFYLKGWRLLLGGLTAIILLSILLQYLTTLSSWLTSLSLGGLLLLLYGLLILIAGAYIVVALGAQKLMKIEEA